MRQFFISFMAAIAGFWFSMFLAFFGFFMMMGMLAAGLGNASASSLQKVSKHSILTIDLGNEISERATPSDQFMALLDKTASKSMPLNTLLAAVRYAASDKDIDGIYLKCNGATVGLAQSQAIVRALNDFKESGKWIYAYGNTFTQGNYYIASVADSIFINPVGMLDIHGLSSTTIYLKNLLDKVGVEMQVVKVGTFKSAVEPFMLSSMSDANRLQQEVFLGKMWSVISCSIADSRNITPQRLNAIADSACYSRPVDYYIANRLVDRDVYEHDFDQLMADLTDQENARLIDISDYISTRSIQPFESKGKKKIAVVYAVGEIVDDGTEGIVASSLVPQIYDIVDDESVNGLILRVNSPGGSAFASEQIWKALECFKRSGRPFYVSMSDYAASGGYYISCGADSIFAEPLTLTGSIGIYGMIPSAEKLMHDKLGLNAETVATNPSGDFPGIFKSMSPDQRRAMQAYVDRGYELFTHRCAEGRDMPIDSLLKIAEGRVWDGTTALNIGLVDALGGLDRAIASMKRYLDDDNCEIVEYPDVEFDLWNEVKRSFVGFRTYAVRAELGQYYPYFKAIKQLDAVAPLQCRMESVIIE